MIDTMADNMTDTKNVLKFPKKEVLPPDCQNTDAVWLVDISYSNQQMKTVTDFTTGDKRYYRWASSMSLAVLPRFDEMPVNIGPTLIPKVPSMLFTADTIPELRARMIYEIDKALGMMEMAVNDPEEYKKKYGPTEDDMC